MRLAALVCMMSGACTSAWSQSARPPFTAAEIERALAPSRALEARCYRGSASERAERAAQLELLLYVDRQGSVRSDPIAGDLRDPALIECVRTGLDALRFPAGREPDQLRFALAFRR